MTGQQLKNSILQMAVQGKLVPQDPNDEPASVLLEKIRKEKERLIKEGKIKKEKNPSYIFRGADNLPYEKVGNNEPVCIADEVPFEIPESWEWIRLGSLVQVNPRNNLPDELEVGFMPMSLLEGGFNNKHTFDVRKWRDIKNGFTHFSDGDVVVAKITPCFQNRKSAVISDLPNGYGAGTTELHVLRDNTHLIYMPYLLLICKTNNFITEGVKNFTGTAGQQRVSKEYFLNYLVPLPPIQEQHRIISCINELLPSVEKYDQLETELNALQDSLPDQLKKSILQEAVQGKLVPQDPNDEPASVLLEQIREEKQRLVKEGKIKKDKHESVIFRRDNSYYEKLDGNERCIDGEIPFEIPESWGWCRLKSIVNIVSAQRVHQSDWRSEGVPFYRAREIGKLADTGYVENDLYITEALYAKLASSGVPHSGDLMVTAVGTLGKAYIVKDDDRFYYKDASVICFENFSNVCPAYLKILMCSPYMKDQIKQSSAGTTVSTITIVKANEYLIPLPPLKEQKRIVDRIDCLQQYINNL